MKTIPSIPFRNRHTSGGTLIATLVTSAIIGTAMASYLTMVSVQNRSVMRSLSWNSAIPVLEAGIEEALTHINQNGTAQLQSDEWTRQTDLEIGGTNLTDTYYVKERTIAGSNYRVAISASSPPIIYSEGSVTVPGDSNRVTRTVRVTTLNDGMWVKGMVAKEGINLNGQNVKTDSFDSSDSRYSTGGAYDPAKARDGGDVATNSGIDGILNVGNANIHGHVSTGPGGSITIGPNGGVGQKSWQASNRGIQPGWVDDDMNVHFPDVSAPYQSALTPTSGRLGGTNYTYLLNGGNFFRTDLSMTGSANTIMLITNNVTLYIEGDFSVGGNASIRIAPNSTFRLYVGGSCSFGGNGVANQTGSATNFYYYGLPGNTQLSLSGNAAFLGAIYAPSANFSMNGGGRSTTNDFTGASVTRTVTMNGHFNFHYDELLGRVGPSRGFVVVSWNEL